MKQNIPPFTLYPGTDVESGRIVLKEALFELVVHQRSSPALDEIMDFLREVGESSMPAAYEKAWPYWLKQIASRLGEDVGAFKDMSYWKQWVATKHTLLQDAACNPFDKMTRAKVQLFLTNWFLLARESLALLSPIPPSLILYKGGGDG